MKALLFLAGLSLAACAPQSVTLHPTFVAHDALRDRRPASSGEAICRYKVVVQDGRDPNESMGGLSPSFIDAKEILTWLRSGLSALNTSNYRLDFDPVEGAAGTPIVHVRLRTAYLRTIVTSLSTNVVLTVELRDPAGKNLAQRNVRGTDTSMNWAFSEAEINGSFNRSLELALVSVDKFVAQQCAPPPAATQLRSARAAS